MNAIFLVFGIIVVIFGFTAITGAPYVPSRKREIRRCFERLYKLSERDLLVDLGSGDGKVLKVAESFGAKAVGVELNPILAWWSKGRGLEVSCGDMYRFRFPKKTTVVYVFGDSRDTPKIIRKVQVEAGRLGQEIFVISLAFQAKGVKGVSEVKQDGVYFLYKVAPQTSSNQRSSS